VNDRLPVKFAEKHLDRLQRYGIIKKCTVKYIWKFVINVVKDSNYVGNWYIISCGNIMKACLLNALNVARSSSYCVVCTPTLSILMGVNDCSYVLNVPVGLSIVQH